MPYSASTGIYTPAAGATTATAGATIASATWNNINNDYTTALTALGPSNLPFMNGAVEGVYFTAAQTVNFGAAASDIGTFAIASILPPGITTYAIQSIRIGKAQGTLSGVTVTLYTGAAATGTTVVGSTSTTITTSTGYQVINGSINSVFTSATLFLHISTSVNTASLANVSLAINPVY